MRNTDNIVRVVAGLIQNEAGDYLVAQRSAQMSNAGKWEFPGGKVEEGETDEAAIVRELREELGIVVHPRSTIGTVLDTKARPQIRLIGIQCTITNGKAQPLEHAAIRWASPAVLRTVNLCRSDIALLKML